MSIVDKAEAFACERHLGMRGKKTSDIDHLKEVSELVLIAGGTENMIAAAWLHDVVEDTGVSLEDVRATFGKEIAILVDGLTDPASFEKLPLAERKALQAKRIVRKPDEVKLIKLSDQLSNIGIVFEDPHESWSEEFCFLYIQGAYQVAKGCFGISEKLDQKFLNVYRRGVEKYYP